MSIVLVGSTSGSVTLQEPAVAGSTVLTLPAVTGTVLTTTSPKAGNVIQVVQGVVSSQQTTTSSSYVDVTGLTATITPTSASSKILVLVTPNFYVSTDGNGYPQYFVQLLRTSTAIFTKHNYMYADRAANSYFEMAGDGNMIYLDSPNTTSATTYKVQTKQGSGSGTVTLVYQMTSADSSITLMEIAA
jgi:hypothetical protein